MMKFAHFLTKHVIKLRILSIIIVKTHKLIAEALLKYETLDAAQIKSIYETGKMPEELENDSEEAHALSYDEVKEKMDDSDDSKE